MGISLNSNFTVNVGLPLDDRAVVADLTARDAIAAGRRYDGLVVYVVADSTAYQLRGGVTNSDWVEANRGGGGTYWYREITGLPATANINIPALQVTGLDIGNTYKVTINAKCQRTTSDVDEVQLVTFDAVPTSGSFTLAQDTLQSTAIPFNATAAQVKTALESIFFIDTNGVDVTGNFTDGFTITFVNTEGGRDQNELTIGANSLAVGFVAAVDEVQTLTAGSASLSGGTFTLEYDGQTTAAISYSASAAAVESALEALSNITDVSVTKSTPSGTTLWQVTFTGVDGATDQQQITIPSSSLSSSATNLSDQGGFYSNYVLPSWGGVGNGQGKYRLVGNCDSNGGLNGVGFSDYFRFSSTGYGSQFNGGSALYVKAGYWIPLSSGFIGFPMSIQTRVYSGGIFNECTVQFVFYNSGGGIISTAYSSSSTPNTAVTHSSTPTVPAGTAGVMVTYTDRFQLDVYIDYIIIGGNQSASFTAATSANGAAGDAGTVVTPSVVTVNDGLDVSSPADAATKFGLALTDNGVVKARAELLSSGTITENSYASVTDTKVFTADATTFEVTGVGLNEWQNVMQGSSLLVEDITGSTSN